MPAKGLMSLFNTNPWDNSTTGVTPTIRSGPLGNPASGNSAVTNLLERDEPVPMGQAGSKADLMADRFARGLKTPQTNEGDQKGWFPPADPRNDPDVLDPTDGNAYLDRSRRLPVTLLDGGKPHGHYLPPGQGAPGNPGRPYPPTMIGPDESMNDDMPKNPFSGLGQSQLQDLLQQLQEMLGQGGGSPGHPNPGAPYQNPPWRPGGGAGPTRPGEQSNAELIYLGGQGQRPTRPQSGMEPGYEPPDYVDDIRPPPQRPMTTYATRSDRRLKSHIVRIGTHPQHGIGIYDYVIDGHPDTGVMAQDLLSVLPSAVSVGQDGFYRVDYSVL